MHDYLQVVHKIILQVIIGYVTVSLHGKLLFPYMAARSSI